MTLVFPGSDQLTVIGWQVVLTNQIRSPCPDGISARILWLLGPGLKITNHCNLPLFIWQPERSNLSILS